MGFDTDSPAIEIAYTFGCVISDIFTMINPVTCSTGCQRFAVFALSQHPASAVPGDLTALIILKDRPHTTCECSSKSDIDNNSA